MERLFLVRIDDDKDVNTETLNEKLEELNVAFIIEVKNSKQGCDHDMSLDYA